MPNSKSRDGTYCELRCPEFNVLLIKINGKFVSVRIGLGPNYMSTNASHMPILGLELLLIRCLYKVLFSPVASKTIKFYCQI